MDALVSLLGYTVFREDRVGSKSGSVFIHNQILSQFVVTPLSAQTRGIESRFWELHSMIMIVFSSMISEQQHIVTLIGEYNRRG